MILDNILYATDENFDFSSLKPGTMFAGRDGIYLRKQNDIVDALVRVEVSPEIPVFAKLNIPVIPYYMIYSLYDFFNKVCSEKRKCEALAILYLDFDNQKYYLDIPDQECSEQHCIPIDYVTPERYMSFLRVGSIHSHSTFRAYHSATDENSEVHWDGLHITLGNVDKDEISISVSVVINANRFLQEPMDWITDIVPIVKRIPSMWNKNTHTIEVTYNMKKPENYIDFSEYVDKINIVKTVDTGKLIHG